jgi:hypothetical protein
LQPTGGNPLTYHFVYELYVVVLYEYLWFVLWGEISNLQQ